MSSLNAPIPDGTGPAEVFDSTASAPHGQTVSAIGIPAGPPQETPMHTGMMNTIDQLFKVQYVPIDTVTWSVTQTAGTLMWKRPIHPKYCHEGINYLMGLYNCWSGGIDFNFKVAGTGFHAGAIAIVRIPPNRRPEDFLTPSSWGLFEYVVIDPKTLEVESLGVSDQRPIMYHYKEFDEDNPNTFGGWLAMYTLLSLNTSSTGSQQIQIQVFSKPNMNWQPSQGIMPTVTTVKPDFPLSTEKIFDFSSYTDVLSTSLTTLQYIGLQPKAIVSTTYVGNCLDLNGKKLSKFNIEADDFKQARDEFKNVPHVLPFFDYSTTENTTSVTFASNFPKPYCKPQANTRIYFQGINESYQVESFFAPKTTVSYIEGPGTIRWEIEGKSTVLTSSTPGRVIFTALQDAGPPPDAVLAPPIPNESPVLFLDGNGDAPCKSVQTFRMTNAFFDGMFKNVLPSGTCALFAIIDTNENLPLGYVKLYAEGFFTSRSLDKLTYLNAKNIRFTFVSYILRTDAMPNVPSYAVNRMLLSVPAPSLAK